MADTIQFSPAEQTWVNEHQKLRIGYADSYLPFSGTNMMGNATGVMIDIFSQLSYLLNLTEYLDIKYVSFPSYNKMLDALSVGDVDVVFPVMKSDIHASQNCMYQTDPLVFSAISAVYEGKFGTNKLEKIAINKNAVLQEIFIREYLPESQIVYCNSMTECLEAIKEGRAGSCLYNSSRIKEALLGNYESFSEMALGRAAAFSIGVDQTNPDLFSLFEKGVSELNKETFSYLMFKYVENSKTYQVRDFLREYAVNIVVISLIVSLLIVLIIFHFLRKAQRAEAEAINANKAKTLFLNNMSHDIRTPMNAIMGFATIALKQNPRPEIGEFLKKICDSSEQLLSLINDVLDISRIESGKTIICPAPANITTITDDVIEVINGFTMGRKLNIVIEREPIPCPYLLVDKVHVREVLVNILSNAVKFTPDDGTIKFKTHSYSSNDAQNIVNIVYTISDTGIGMTEEFQKHLFEEFSQESTGARTQYKGTGLGMAIVKKYVDMMNGTITVHSKKMSGTTFIVDIPFEVTDMSLVKKHEEVSSAESLLGIKALLAEDNDLNAEIATILLEDAGIEVTRVENGKRAVEVFEQKPEGTFDIILMDIMMPEMNGYEATRAIRSLAHRQDSLLIPIVAMTANAFVEDVQASIEAGMNEHIAKPLVIEDVIRTIAQVVKNKK
ncbi:MAG: ATP-binding protein [Bacteroidales bacterium]|nr:ATP-binding protein [Bacteroidales bacterium]